MTNLLILSDNSKDHYFSHSGRGIFVRRLDSGALPQTECIIEDVKGPFWAYRDSGDVVHIIYTDQKNNLSYALRRDNAVKTFALTQISQDISPCMMQIYQISGRLNWLCSAKYKEEYILIHCILGNNAKPQKITSLSSPHFWIYNNGVYYTNKNGKVGYTDLSDEKPEGFNEIYDSGDNVSLYKIGDKTITLTTNSNRLFINGQEIIYDSRMEIPTICTARDTVYAMWRSGGYVRYVILDSSGTPTSAPMRFMTSGAEIHTYFAQTMDNTQMFYGYNTACSVHLFGKPDIM